MTMAAVLFHKNPISARLRLLQFADGGVIGPERPVGECEREAHDASVPHPGALLGLLREHLDLSADDLHAHACPLLWVGGSPVFAVECTALEPPQKLAEQIGGTWIDFTAVRTLKSTDQQAARSLYTQMIG